MTAKIAVLTTIKHEYDLFLKFIDSEDQERFHWVSRIQDTKGIEFSEVIRLKGFMHRHESPLELLANTYMRVR